MKVWKLSKNRVEYFQSRKSNRNPQQRKNEIREIFHQEPKAFEMGLGDGWENRPEALFSRARSRVHYAIGRAIGADTRARFRGQYDRLVAEHEAKESNK